MGKLVRDKIPEIIEASGATPLTRILETEEYLSCLEAKLDEEVQEFHESKSPEELADILEVVYALAEAHGCSREQLQQIFDTKHTARGGFEKRIYWMGNRVNEQKERLHSGLHRNKSSAVEDAKIRRHLHGVGGFPGHRHDHGRN